MYIRLFVCCNCIRNRKLKPVPEKYRPYLRFDDNIIYLDYNGGSINPAIEEEPEPYDHEWDEWLENACEHGNWFHAFSGTIGPQSRLIPLIRILQEMPHVGLQNILSAVNCIDSLEIKPEKAAECLIELGQFKSNFPHVTGTLVMDEQTGAVLDILIGDETKSLYICENYQVGYDREGIRVTRNGLPGALPETLFHSCRFQQDVLPYCASLLEDIPSGKIAELMRPVFPLENCSFPAVVSINCRELTPEDFNYLTDPFEKAFKASVEAGNPVYIICDQSAVDLVF